MNDSSHDPRIPVNLEAVDPLGEIRSYASELWRSDGSPADKTWKDYWQQAEETILGGKSRGEPSERTRQTSAPSARRIPDIFAEYLEKNDRPLLTLVLTTFRRTLTEHETLCLANILQTHQITTSTSSFTPVGEAESAEIAAVIANEYDSSFLSNCQTDNLLAIPLARRSEYWLSKLKASKQKDEALSFNERNTIYRLLDELKHGSDVVDVVFAAQPAELA